MFSKLLEFLKKIFKYKDIKLLEESSESKTRNTDTFRNNIQFDDGKKGQELLDEILSEEVSTKTQKELQEQLIDYIDVLIKKIDKCKNDIAIKRFELNNKVNDN